MHSIFRFRLFFLPMLAGLAVLCVLGVSVPNVSAETVPQVPSAVVPSPALSSEEVAARTKAATVNIVCNAARDAGVNSISGSGVFVSPAGIILTNAHVAQFFLLQNKLGASQVSCTIRAGDPAVPTYTVQLLYESPFWIARNETNLSIKDPTGTGQNDYAFLYVTGTIDPRAALPSAFPYLPPHVSEFGPAELARNTPIWLGGYPGELIQNPTINTQFPYTSGTTTVSGLYTFNEDVGAHGELPVDVMAMSGTSLAQRGSSGGPVVSMAGELLGLIVTSTDEREISQRELRAITIPYINRALAAEDGYGLQQILSKDNIPKRLGLFTTILSPILASLLSLNLHPGT